MKLMSDILENMYKYEDFSVVLNNNMFVTFTD